MAVSPEYRTFVEELFAPVFAVRVRAMFGGAGIYSGDTMFGLIADERVYLKVDDLTRADFAAESCGPFVWVAPDGQEMAMGYFELPARLYDDTDELKAWAMKALDVALRARKTPARKPAKKKAAKKNPAGGAMRAQPRALANRKAKAKPRRVRRK